MRARYGEEGEDISISPRMNGVYYVGRVLLQQRRRHKPDDIYKIKSTNTCTPRHMRLCKLDLYIDANIRLMRPG